MKSNLDKCLFQLLVLKYWTGTLKGLKYGKVENENILGSSLTETCVWESIHSIFGKGN